MFFHRGGFGGDDSPSAGKVPDETKDARLTLSACWSSAGPQWSLADRQPTRHGATVRAVRLRARPRSCEPALARPAAPDTRPSARVPAACWCVPAPLVVPVAPGHVAKLAAAADSRCLGRCPVAPPVYPSPGLTPTQGCIPLSHRRITQGRDVTSARPICAPSTQAVCTSTDDSQPRWRLCRPTRRACASLHSHWPQPRCRGVVDQRKLGRPARKHTA